MEKLLETHKDRLEQDVQDGHLTAQALRGGLKIKNGQKEEGLQDLTEAADAGDPMALTALVHEYHEGLNIEKSKEKEALALQKLEEIKPAVGLYLRGLQKQEDAFKSLPRCMLLDGFQLDEEENNPESEMKNAWKEAETFYLQSASLGSEEAQWALANLYRDEVIDGKSPEDGLKLMSELALKGNLSAMSALSHMYLEGKGSVLPQAAREMEAFNWMKKVADSPENTESRNCATVAAMYQYGRGTVPSNIQAEAYYKKGLILEEDDDRVQHALAHFYLKSARYAEAFELLTLIKEARYDAYNDLGVMYARGLGVAQSHLEAIENFCASYDHHLVNESTRNLRELFSNPIAWDEISEEDKEGVLQKVTNVFGGPASQPEGVQREMKLNQDKLHA